jgi:hypothetical protein
LNFVVGFEVLTAVVVKSSVFWDITLCSPLQVNQRFGGTCFLFLQGERISQARHQCEVGGKQTFHDLFYNLKDGGNIFLENVGWLSVNYTALYPRR